MWTAVNELEIKNNWVYTKNIEGDYFKIKHLSAKVGNKYIFAQASLAEGSTNIEIFEAQILEVKLASEEILKVKKPPIFKNRMLAFRKLKPDESLESELRRLAVPSFFRASTRTVFPSQPSTWKVQIEVSDIVDVSPASTPTSTPTPMPNSSSSYLAFDEFTDTDNTLLSAHVMNVGRGWQISHPIWKISGNKVISGLQQAGGSLALTDTLKFNVSVVSRITWFNGQSNSQQGLAIRGLDSANYWSCRYVFANQLLTINEVINGVNIQKASKSIILAANSTTKLEIAANNNTIRVLLDDVEQLTFVMPENHPLKTATKCGLWSYEATSGSGFWDNFKVVELV